ncbi:MAG TPA: phosphoribosyltransferase family protein, partial [Candidatus Limnocylindrales bacterium]|nr:phosphoribosyltransferase family protein [Candidatus Limnocylindrales bacterium]
MFIDRADAGARLAARLAHLRPVRPLVLGLARGGVVVAAEVARRLDADLDAVVVRKVGVPWHPELGVGAIAEGGIVLLNPALIAELGLARADIARVIRRERRVLRERVAEYRRDRPATALAGRVVVLVDDGLATGFTARAAIASARRRGAERVVLASPVAPPSVVAQLRPLVDEIVVVDEPDFFTSIGEHYLDFSETTDDDVRRLLGTARPAVA